MPNVESNNLNFVRGNSKTVSTVFEYDDSDKNKLEKDMHCLLILPNSSKNKKNLNFIGNYVSFKKLNFVK